MKIIRKGKIKLIQQGYYEPAIEIEGESLADILQNFPKKEGFYDTVLEGEYNILIEEI